MIEYDHGCTLCPLHGGAKTVCVPGDGPDDAEIMIVGQNPGKNEDEQGRPFIGKAGHELSSMLLEAGIARDRCFVTNAVKCLTPKDRKPSKKEMRACLGYLVAEISNRRPKIIILLGGVSLEVLTGETSITKVRGGRLDFSSAMRENLNVTDYEPLIVATLHPSAVHHSPKGEAIRAQIVGDLKTAIAHAENTFEQIDVPWVFNDTLTPGDIYLGEASRAGEVIAYDIETNAKELYDPALRITQIAIDNGSDVVPVFRGRSALAAIELLRQAGALGATLVGHNASAFDRAVIHARTGVSLKSEDTQLMAHLLYEDDSKKLQELCVKHLGVAPWKDEVTWPWDPGPSNEDEWQTFGLYNARDARYTRLLYIKLREQLAQDPLLENYYDTFFLPFSRALSAIQRNGVYLSLEAISSLWGAAEIRRTRAQIKCAALTGKPDFNPGSAKQVRELLYGPTSVYKLPAQEFTDGDDASTDILSLRKTKYDLEEGDKVTELVDAILEYRKAGKLIGTYYQKFLGYVQDDGRCYPSYYLTGSVSRSSASDPPIQTTPRIGFEGVVSAPPGSVLVHADFSQMELRIAAHLSRDPEMMGAFSRGDDLHYLLAQSIVKRDVVTKEERSRAKPANFSYLFDADPYTFESIALKEYDLMYTREESSLIHSAFHTRWARLKPWYDEVEKQAIADGLARSEDGRVRHITGLGSRDQKKARDARRQAINFPVQNFGLTLGGLMVILAVGQGLKVVRFVHDSCDVECAPEQADAVIARFKEMESLIPAILANKFGVRFSVPIVIDAHVA